MASCSIRSILTGSYPALNLLHLLAAVIAIGVLGICWRHLRLAHSLWAGAHVLASFFGLWRGIGRFVLPAFPVFVAAALLLKRKSMMFAVSYLNTLLLALFTMMYTHLYWVS
jgi:hypothetical protein